MAQYTYKQKLGLQDQRGKGILVGKLFSGCVSVGKSLNLSDLGFLIWKMKVLNCMILKSQLNSKILQNNLGLWGYLDVLSLSLLSRYIYAQIVRLSCNIYLWLFYSLDSDISPERDDKIIWNWYEPMGIRINLFF